MGWFSITGLHRHDLDQVTLASTADPVRFRVKSNLIYTETIRAGGRRRPDAFRNISHVLSETREHLSVKCMKRRDVQGLRSVSITAHTHCWAVKNDECLISSLNLSLTEAVLRAEASLDGDLCKWEALWVLLTLHLKSFLYLWYRLV